MSLLSDRLLDIFSAVKSIHSPDGRIIDVGSDHGYLALECLKQGICPRVICTDIHEGPADRTRLTLSLNGFKDSSKVYTTDGTDGLDMLAGDTVVIAGMGGLTTIDIVERIISKTSPTVLKSMSFCFQPQKSAENLRLFLAANGFRIENEFISKDKNFFYLIITAKYTGIPYSLTKEEQYYGPKLLNNRNETIDDYFNHLNKLFQVRAKGNEEIRQLLEDKNEI